MPSGIGGVFVVNSAANTTEEYGVLNGNLTPTDDMLPKKINQISPEQAAQVPVIATASLSNPRKRAFVPAAAAGGNLYGYDWLKNNTVLKTDKDTVLGIYEALSSWAAAMYNTTADYTLDSSGDFAMFGRVDFDANLQAKLPYDSFNPAGTVSQDSLKLMMLAYSIFQADNPQYYQILSDTIFYGNTTANLTAIVPTLSADCVKHTDRAAVQARIDAEYQTYAGFVANQGVTDAYDKVRLIHDMICAKTDYSMVDRGQGYRPDTRPTAHDIRGVLDPLAPGPVCESFAEAFTYIINRLSVKGLEALTVIGKAGSGGNGGGGGHAWNVVKINGSWFYLDITWNNLDNTDPGSPLYDSGNKINPFFYKYFLSGSANTDWGAGSTHKNADYNPANSSDFFMFELPTISSADYDRQPVGRDSSLPNGKYRYLSDNGFYGQGGAYSTVTTQDDYNYIITKTITPYSSNISDNPLLLDTPKTYYGPYNLGSYNASSAIPLYMYPYRYDAPGWSGKFMDLYGLAFVNPGDPVRKPMTQGKDYTVEFGQGNAGDTVRVWFYGKGDYKGIDFAWVTLTANVTPPPADTTPPTVTTVLPNGQNIARSGNVVITFNEEMNTAAGTVKLNASALSAGIWSNGEKTYTIAYSNLAYSAAYTVNISGFKDIAGNTMAADGTHSFTTAAKPDAAVTIGTISGIAVPSAGAAPITGVTETAQYTGAVTWSPAASGTFGYNTVYKATITLTAKAGYTFNGVSANFFKVPGAVNTTNNANSGVVTAEFPKTAINRAEQDAADVASAQSVIENTIFETAQSECADEAAVLSKINAVLDSLQLNGVTKVIVKESYVAPVAGTIKHSAGTNGSYVFTVELNKGSAAQAVTAQITLKIAATAYEFKTYKVTFDINGGKSSYGWQGSKQVTELEKVGALPENPSKNKHRFKGWNTKADGSGTAFTELSEVTGDITVYAQWEAVDDGAAASSAFNDWLTVGCCAFGLLVIVLLVKARNKRGTR